jgi:hypothetical protein
MSTNPNRRGAPPRDSLWTSKQVECPVFFEVVFILFAAAAFVLAWICL